LRRLPALLLGSSLALLAFGATAGAALIEPVTVTATAPETVTAGTPFPLEVAVEAEPGTLGIAAQPLRVRVKLATECGGSFAGTPGPTALEQTLPAPGAGTYTQKVTGKVTVASPGTDVVCAFLEDAQERQFATDTEEEVTVVSATAATHQCTAATKQLTVAKRKLKRLEHRIHKVKKKLRHARGAHRKALARKLHKLRVHKRKAAKRRKVAARNVAGVCS
jgi:hypothetical protein